MLRASLKSECEATRNRAADRILGHLLHGVEMTELARRVEELERLEAKR